MAVFRIEKTRDYTVMSNHHLRNAGLSLKSKGLLSMMLSLPEDWNYTTRGLAKICKEGTDSIGSALKELERAGYIVRNRIRDSKGKIVDVEYVIYETPHPPDTGQPCEDEPDTACPDTENPDMDNPCLENRPQLNKEKRSPEEQNTDSPRTEGSNPIQSSPQAPAGAKRTGQDWMRERESYRELILENIEYDYLGMSEKRWMNGRQLWIGTVGGVPILFQNALHVVLRHHFSATFCSRIEKVIVRVLFGMVKMAVILVVF